MNVLLVEDDDVDARLVSRTLEQQNTPVQLSRLPTLPTQRPVDTFDAVLLDLGLPGSNGLETLHLALQVLNDTPIIVLTGLDDDHIGEAAVSLGAQDFLVKGQYGGSLLHRTLRFAVQRGRLRNQMQRVAFHDPLTNLPNRQLFTDRLQHAVDRSNRSQHPICLAFIDLDGFKAVNDTYGHDAGDTLLVQVARRLEGTLRASDTVARLGGDEFVCIFEDLPDRQTGVQLGLRTQQMITGSYLLPTELGNQTVQLGASTGLAFAPWDARDPTQLIQLADKAMYTAKRSGGRQVIEAQSIRAS